MARYWIYATVFALICNGAAQIADQMSPRFGTQLDSQWLSQPDAKFDQLDAQAASQCGTTADAKVTGQQGAYTTTLGNRPVYTGPSYLAAIQTGINAIRSGQSIAVIASGSISTGILSLSSGKTFSGCGTLHASSHLGHGAIEILNAANVHIPFLTMTGNPYFGLRISGSSNLILGHITMDLSGGLGIRFDRDAAPNINVEIGIVRVNGAGSHAVETWNINGLVIRSVIARNCGECGLLIQNTINAHVGLVDGDNVGYSGDKGYATLRFANRNGRVGNDYPTNVYVDSVVSRGGGRGFFCVSESGGAEIKNVDLRANENNAILIENCYNVNILAGTVNGGGQVRLSARTEFANNRDISLRLEVNENSVWEHPCGINSRLLITGNAKVDICRKGTGLETEQWSTAE